LILGSFTIKLQKSLLPQLNIKTTLKMRNSFSLFLFPSCSLFLALFFLVTPVFAQEDTLKIGISAPLSGDVSAWGEDTQRALVIANELLADNKAKLIFEDDRCLGRLAVTNARKLISVDNIDFGMTICTEPTISAAPVFNQEQIVMVSPGGTGAAVSDAGEYIFRTWPSDREMIGLVSDHINSKHKRVALLSENRGFPQEFSRVFLQSAKETGLEVSSDDFQTEEGDFRSLLLRVRQRNPEALIVNTDSERTLLNILTQIDQLEWEIPLYGNFIAGTQAFLSKAGHLAEGMVFGDSPVVNCSKNYSGCEVFEEFNRRHGAAASTEYMIASSVAAFTAILEASTATNPRQFLLESTFESAIGPFSFKENGDVVGPAPVLRRIESGAAVLITDSQ